MRLNLLRVAQWASLASGLVLCVGYGVAVIAGEAGRRADINAFANVASLPTPVPTARSSDQSTSEASATNATPDQQLWSSVRIREFFASKDLPVSEPVAVLRVPSLSLAVPVYPNASELHLNRGAGLIEGMTGPDEGGNIGMAGHRDGYFRVLKDITVGTQIEVQTRHRIHRYRVTSIDIVPAEDNALLHDTLEPTVTLVTCYPFYFIGNAPQRFIVRGAYEWAASKSTS